MYIVLTYLSNHGPVSAEIAVAEVKNLRPLHRGAPYTDRIFSRLKFSPYLHFCPVLASPRLISNALIPLHSSYISTALSLNMLLFLRPRTATLTASLASNWSRRSYSIHADHAAQRQKDIDPTSLTITKTTSPKELIPNHQLVFGRSFTGEFNWPQDYLI